MLDAPRVLTNARHSSAWSRKPRRGICVNPRGCAVPDANVVTAGVRFTAFNAGQRNDSLTAACARGAPISQ